MAKVNISEAIKLSGVSRQSFYTKYLNGGIVSVEKDNFGKKWIDTSELVRVFGNIGIDTQDKTPDTFLRQVMTPESRSIDALQTEVNLLREHLQDYKHREQRLLAQIDNLTIAIKQIEYKPGKNLSFIDRLLGR